MGVYAGPDINENGLVLALDAGNTKGYDKYENLLNYSEQFDNAAWSKVNTSVSANATVAPDGTLTADNVTNTPNSGSYLAQVKSGLSTTTTYTASVYVKPLTTNKVVALEWGGAFSIFNLSTLTTSGSGPGQITTLNNGWYRISSTVTNVTSFNVIYIGAYGNTADTVTVALWGAQLEIGSSVTEYYPTTSTTKTRGSTLIDLSGRGNNGTLTNGPTYSSSNGGSIVFDGTNDYIVRNSTTIDLSAGVTMEMIFKSIDMNSREQGFMQFNTHPNYINFYTPGNGYLRWETWVPVSVAGGAYTTPTALSNNTWYHAVGTYSNGSSKLYINGINVSSASQTSGTYSSSYTANLVIGEYAGYMSGNVAIAKIYNRALTANEVKQNFNATRGRFGI